MSAANERPLPQFPGRVKLGRDFDDSIGDDLLTLADYAGNQLVILNAMDLTSEFTMSGAVGV
eukprot:6885051-Pyramimonas_sp.AAC.2